MTLLDLQRLLERVVLLTALIGLLISPIQAMNDNFTQQPHMVRIQFGECGMIPIPHLLNLFPNLTVNFTPIATDIQNNKWLYELFGWNDAPYTEYLNATIQATTDNEGYLVVPLHQDIEYKIMFTYNNNIKTFYFYPSENDYTIMVLP
jgi:hypothetical protein